MTGRVGNWHKELGSQHNPNISKSSFVSACKHQMLWQLEKQQECLRANKQTSAGPQKLPSTKTVKNSDLMCFSQIPQKIGELRCLPPTFPSTSYARQHCVCWLNYYYIATVHSCRRRLMLTAGDPAPLAAHLSQCQLPTRPVTVRDGNDLSSLSF